MTTLLAFIFVVGILVLIHELGHFLAARWAGIRVERFSIGLPKHIWKKKIGDTEYCIGAVPLGGYVKMAGMIDESLDAKIEGKPDEFTSKPIWKRAIVIAAGPVMNIVLAVVLFAGLAFFAGIPELVPEIRTVLENSPAQSIGLQPGDRIITVAGQDIRTWQELTAVIHANPEKPLAIAWERNGERMSAEVTPRLDPEAKIGLIGISPKEVRRQVGFIESWSMGANLSWQVTAQMGRMLARLLRGEGSLKKELTGPIGIAVIAGEAARQSFESLIELMALISVNLALMNLLPIPVLDGGHLVFLGLEAVMRRPVPVRARLVMHQVVIALLLVLTVFITFNDIQRLLQKVW
jgi:regulator of sigma E protease